jgi:DNA-binding CsgD family transcriptional regulator
MDMDVMWVMDIWKKAFLSEKSERGTFTFPENLEEITGWSLPGPSYCFIVDLASLDLNYISPGVYDILGITPEEVDLYTILKMILPEHVEAVFNKEQTIIDFYYNYVDKDKLKNYKTLHFFTIEDRLGNERIIMHQATPISQTNSSKPWHFMVSHTDVSHLYLKPDPRLSLLDTTGKKSFYNVNYEDGTFQPPIEGNTQEHPYFEFTEREKEIIGKYSEGMSTSELADHLHISVHTLRTHRKNILKKSPFKNMNDLLVECKFIGVV